MIIGQDENIIVKIDINDLKWVKKSVNDSGQPCIVWREKYSDYNREREFECKEIRDATFNLIKKELLERNSQQIERKFNPMKTLKDYFNKHQDTIITLGVIWLIDYYLFEGKFQDKIKNLVDKLLGNVERKLTEKSDDLFPKN